MSQTRPSFTGRLASSSPRVPLEALSLRYKRLPGLTVGFSQPLIDMVNDKIAGAHSELVVKIYGRDFKVTRAAPARFGINASDIADTRLNVELEWPPSV